MAPTIKAELEDSQYNFQPSGLFDKVPPEIVSQIGSYLKGKDARSFALVCHRFNIDIRPHLFRSVGLFIPFSHDWNLTRKVAFLTKGHGRDVRTLRLFGLQSEYPGDNVMTELMTTFPNLTKFYLCTTESWSWDDIFDLLIQVCTTRPLLKVVQLLIWVGPELDLKDVETLVKTMPKMEHGGIQSLTLKVNNMDGPLASRSQEFYRALDIFFSQLAPNLKHFSFIPEHDHYSTNGGVSKPKFPPWEALRPQGVTLYKLDIQRHKARGDLSPKIWFAKSFREKIVYVHFVCRDSLTYAHMPAVRKRLQSFPNTIAVLFETGIENSPDDENRTEPQGAYDADFWGNFARELAFGLRSLKFVGVKNKVFGDLTVRVDILRDGYIRSDGIADENKENEDPEHESDWNYNEYYSEEGRETEEGYEEEYPVDFPDIDQEDNEEEQPLSFPEVDQEYDEEEHAIDSPRIDEEDDEDEDEDEGEMDEEEDKLDATETDEKDSDEDESDEDESFEDESDGEEGNEEETDDEESTEEEEEESDEDSDDYTNWGRFLTMDAQPGSILEHELVSTFNGVGQYLGIISAHRVDRHYDP